MSKGPTRGERKAGVAGVAVIALAITCCAGGPLIVGLLGSVAVGTVLGVGAGALVAVAVALAIALRVRARRNCEPRLPREVGR